MMSDSLLPKNSTPLERALERLFARHMRFDLTAGQMWSPDTCPPAALKYLAWALSVDHWDPTWPVDKKRAAIRNSVEVHRWKGTLRGVEAALTAAGYPHARIVEGMSAHRRDGTRLRDGSITHGNADHWAKYTVYLPNVITVAEAQNLRRMLKTVAPVHCELAQINFTPAAHSHDGTIRRDGTYTRGAA